ncbi:MAG: outer membrane protein assembly factor BamD [Candidatus Hydrogenedentes bacterium]|nr:outer membrane protein assembly factor BamD [Candidatus Hydrogenedentota bacterium]
MAVLLACLGCVTSQDNFAPLDAAPASDLDGTLNSNSAAASELSEAQRLIRAGDYSTAIPRLMKIVQVYPNSTAGVDSRYFLGVAFYKIGGTRDASAHFSKYLELAPEGRYAQLSKDYVRGFLTTGPQAEKAERKDRIEALESIDDAALLPEKLELANLYWENTEYEKAGEIYFQLLAAWPRLENDRIVRTRLERQPDGTLVLLTPAEVNRRYNDQEPLLVHNTNAYRSGKYQGYGRHLVDTVYNVTGEVVNRSVENVWNVRLVVTIYGLGQKIYETKTIDVGNLAAAQSLPFSVTFTQFDNIENVQRFECKAYYGR